jgi:hypothetical protein
MKQLLIALLFVATVYTPATAGSIARQYPGWKTPQHFEISSVIGYQEVYNADEPIVFYVEGKSDKIDLEQSTGFYMQARIDEFPRTRPVSFAKVQYDPDKRAWQINLTAPKDNTKTYEIQLHLYCGFDDSLCATTYGRAAQVEKILPLKIR